jgi:EAL domain-containing protein (putative c-di-GMP-specific phosphodiesterase class I)
MKYIKMYAGYRYPSRVISHAVRLYHQFTLSFRVIDRQGHRDLLNQIRASGVQLAIDDFGMGYSSLGYLKRFKVSQLKMDKILIDDIDINEESLAIAKAAIALGSSLGLEMVAEGV